MPRPTTKQDLIKSANEQFEKMWGLINSIPEDKQNATFKFGAEMGKEAHWGRDKNLRDVELLPLQNESLEILSEKTICLCGSIKFAPEMKKLGKELEAIGRVPLLPKSVIELDETTAVNEAYDKAKRKREIDAISVHFNKIAKADAILVCNYDKNDIKNYIGANTFLEMGFAHRII